MVKKNNKKPKLSKEQKAENKKRAAYSKQIEDIFLQSGFKKIHTNGKQFILGNRQNELDNCFIYKNVLIICEDTIRELKLKEKAIANGENYNKNHKLEKQETATAINNNKKEFLEILKGIAPDCNELTDYKYNELNIYYLYLCLPYKEFCYL